MSSMIHKAKSRFRGKKLLNMGTNKHVIKLANKTGSNNQTFPEQIDQELSSLHNNGANLLAIIGHSYPTYGEVVTPLLKNTLSVLEAIDYLQRSWNTIVEKVGMQERGTDE